MNARLSKFSRLAMTPSLWPVVALGVAPTMEHAPAFIGRSFDTILDVGANKGQFAAFAAWRWPAARLICYEPLPGPRAKLERVLEICAKDRSEVRPYALGSEAGTFDMHLATREDSSSILALGEAQRRLFGMDEVGQVAVRVARLADEPGLESLGRALLKIDVQGFEHQVLAGGSDRLEDFDAIYVEASFIELYEGQKLVDEVTELIAAHGFRESSRMVNQHENGLPVQADILLTRPNQPFNGELPSNGSPRLSQ